MFEGLRFRIDAGIDERTRGTLRKLIGLGGGADVPAASAAPDAYTIVDDQRPPAGDDKENWGGPVLRKGWVMASIASAALAPLTEFKVAL